MKSIFAETIQQQAQRHQESASRKALPPRDMN